jgi:hypothetical protein
MSPKEPAMPDRNVSRLAVGLVLTLVAAAWADQPTPPAAPAAPGAEATVDLPLTRAVLFSSGVGYFEHSGTVEGNAATRLMFKTDQINDVLKSMVVMDLDGGTAGSVTLGANEPLDRALKSFAVDISGAPTLPDLLGQLRGAQVVLHTGGQDKITGAILGVDSRPRSVGQPPVIVTDYLLNVVTDQGVKSVPLDAAGSIELADPKLRGELDQALRLLTQSRDTERKPVVVRFTGQGKRRVMVGYLVEAPVWKTSYRLDLSPLADKKKPMLQGWAIVENISESDWQKISLTLVSGRPISFTEDLYTPLYAPRPVVVPELFASLMPRRYDEGIAQQAGAEPRLSQESMAGEDRDASGRAGLAPAAPGAAPAPAMALARAFRADKAAAATPVQLGGYGVAPVAQGAKLGELFHYAIADVDLPRRRSAMLPIVGADVTAEKVSIYNQAVLPANPLHGALLTNTTSLSLMGGPITVFDGGAYAGDAQIDSLQPGAQKLLSYAVDLEVTVDPSQVAAPDHIVAVSLVNGVLRVERKTAYTQTYRIHNKSANDRTLVIEHPFYANRKLVEPKEPMEKTPSVYRFKLPVKPAATADFVVQEEEPVSQGYLLLNCPAETLVWYRDNGGDTPKSVRAALAKAIDLKTALSDAERTLAQRTDKLNGIQSGQARLRANLAAVGKDTPLGHRYLDTLAEQEDQIEELAGKKDQPGAIETARQDMEAKRKAFEDFVRTLSVGP